MLVNLSFNQTLLTFLLCETSLDDWIESNNFSVRDFLPLIQNSTTQMHGLAVYVKGGFPFTQYLSLENCRFLLMFSTYVFLLHSVSSFSSINQSQAILLRCLIFLLGSVLLFWIYLFLLMLVFVLQWLSFHLEILIMLS